jgi:HD-GYP domain-containing protein (c-di-GMP phosphodiesterase class II)
MTTRVMKAIAAGAIELGAIPFNLFARDSLGKMVLFCRAGFDITPRHKEKLDTSGRVFFIGADEEGAYFDYALERLESIVANPDIRVSEKTQLVQGVGKHVVKKLLEDPRSGVAVARSGRFVKSYIDLIFAFPEGPRTLLMLSNINVDLYTHSLNVCTFCLLMGERIYGRDNRQLWQLGMGGLLHDIGLSRVELALVTKPDELNEEELEELRRHTIFGHEIASEHGLPEPILVTVRGHHERYDGTGYPDELYGSEIHPFARIGALAEVYDSITTDRLRHKGKPALEALQEIAADHKGFDLICFEALLKVVLHEDKLIDDFRSRHLSATL